MKDHRLIDERTLAFHRMIVEKLRANPALVEKARANIVRWLETCSARVRPALIEWQRIIADPFADLLEATGERATRLRQSSPFCGTAASSANSKSSRTNSTPVVFQRHELRDEVLHRSTDICCSQPALERPRAMWAIHWATRSIVINADR